MFVTLNNAKAMLSKQPFKVALKYPIGKNHFILKETMLIVLSNGDNIRIEKGFQFDGSSSPRFLWWAFPSYGDFFLAALIHDYCYITDYNSDIWGYKKARKFADKEMLLWSNAINDKSFFKLIDNRLRYVAVRLFGKRVFLK